MKKTPIFRLKINFTHSDCNSFLEFISTILADTHTHTKLFCVKETTLNWKDKQKTNTFIFSGDLFLEMLKRHIHTERELYRHHMIHQMAQDIDKKHLHTVFIRAQWAIRT